MAIASRPYNNRDDLHKIQAATADWIASAGFCGYLHVGDLALRLFNGMRRYNPHEIVRLWEAEDGSLLGWSIIYPRWNSYDALLHPAHRGDELEGQLLDGCEQAVLAWMQKEDRAESPISLDVFAEDVNRITALEQRGYVRGEQHHVIGVRSLDEPIPDVSLPQGFSVRPVEGLHEADKLIEAQNASFGWSWTLEDYLQVMQSPANELAEPLVIVAPDGRFASFCYLMLDEKNKIGMFEDVGTHPDFQRKGFGRALLYAGLGRLKAQGMVTTYMPYNSSLEAASALYNLVGFRVGYRHIQYTRKIADQTVIK